MRSLTLQSLRHLSIVTVFLLLTACSGLPKPENEQQHNYLLEAASSNRKAAQSHKLSITISPISAAPGYYTSSMLYIAKPHRLDRFAQHQWADTPAKMLHATLQSHLEAGGLFRDIIPHQSSVRPDLRLQLELIELHQSFLQQPSTVELSVRAHLLDNRQNQLIAGRLFSLRENAAKETPYGGVLAANRAVTDLITKLDLFLQEAIGNWNSKVR